ncbi:hypothetical protein HHI36_014933 [Cryptolaemus montrouzieri]|uniref:Uncharacterized protein n=1 Tax=Cryptolaemus montrouzieri TaxID=559131 RepID=A0ABD2N4X6_9CUCU
MSRKIKSKPKYAPLAKRGYKPLDIISIKSGVTNVTWNSGSSKKRTSYTKSIDGKSVSVADSTIHSDILNSSKTKSPSTKLSFDIYIEKLIQYELDGTLEDISLFEDNDKSSGQKNKKKNHSEEKSNSDLSLYETANQEGNYKYELKNQLDKKDRWKKKQTDLESFDSQMKNIEADSTTLVNKAIIETNVPRPYNKGKKPAASIQEKIDSTLFENKAITENNKISSDNVRRKSVASILQKLDSNTFANKVITGNTILSPDNSRKKSAASIQEKIDSTIFANKAITENTKLSSDAARRKSVASIVKKTDSTTFANEAKTENTIFYTDKIREKPAASVQETIDSTIFVNEAISENNKLYPDNVKRKSAASILENIDSTTFANMAIIENPFDENRKSAASVLGNVSFKNTNIKHKRSYRKSIETEIYARKTADENRGQLSNKVKKSSALRDNFSLGSSENKVLKASVLRNEKDSDSIGQISLGYKNGSVKNDKINENKESKSFMKFLAKHKGKDPLNKEECKLESEIEVKRKDGSKVSGVLRMECSPELFCLQSQILDETETESSKNIDERNIIFSGNRIATSEKLKLKDMQEALSVDRIRDVEVDPFDLLTTDKLIIRPIENLKIDFITEETEFITPSVGNENVVSENADFYGTAKTDLGIVEIPETQLSVGKSIELFKDISQEEISSMILQSSQDSSTNEKSDMSRVKILTNIQIMTPPEKQKRTLSAREIGTESKEDEVQRKKPKTSSADFSRKEEKSLSSIEVLGKSDEVQSVNILTDQSTMNNEKNDNKPSFNENSSNIAIHEESEITKPISNAAFNSETKKTRKRKIVFNDQDNDNSPLNKNIGSSNNYTHEKPPTHLKDLYMLPKSVSYMDYENVLDSPLKKVSISQKSSFDTNSQDKCKVVLPKDADHKSNSFEDLSAKTLSSLVIEMKAASPCQMDRNTDGSFGKENNPPPSVKRKPFRNEISKVHSKVKTARIEKQDEESVVFAKQFEIFNRNSGHLQVTSVNTKEKPLKNNNHKRKTKKLLSRISQKKHSFVETKEILSMQSVKSVADPFDSDDYLPLSILGRKYKKEMLEINQNVQREEKKTNEKTKIENQDDKKIQHGQGTSQPSSSPLDDQRLQIRDVLILNSKDECGSALVQNVGKEPLKNGKSKSSGNLSSKKVHSFVEDKIICPSRTEKNVMDRFNSDDDLPLSTLREKYRNAFSQNEEKDLNQKTSTVENKNAPKCYILHRKDSLDGNIHETPLEIGVNTTILKGGNEDCQNKDMILTSDLKRDKYTTSLQNRIIIHPSSISVSLPDDVEKLSQETTSINSSRNQFAKDISSTINIDDAKIVNDKVSEVVNIEEHSKESVKFRDDSCDHNAENNSPELTKEEGKISDNFNENGVGECEKDAMISVVELRRINRSNESKIEDDNYVLKMLQTQEEDSVEVPYIQKPTEVSLRNQENHMTNIEVEVSSKQFVAEELYNMKTKTGVDQYIGLIENNTPQFSEATTNKNLEKKKSEDHLKRSVSRKSPIIDISKQNSANIQNKNTFDKSIINNTNENHEISSKLDEVEKSLSALFEFDQNRSSTVSEDKKYSNDGYSKDRNITYNTSSSMIISKKAGVLRRGRKLYNPDNLEETWLQLPEIENMKIQELAIQLKTQQTPEQPDDIVKDSITKKTKDSKKLLQKTTNYEKSLGKTRKLTESVWKKKKEERNLQKEEPKELPVESFLNSPRRWNEFLYRKMDEINSKSSVKTKNISCRSKKQDSRLDKSSKYVLDFSKMNVERKKNKLTPKADIDHHAHHIEGGSRREIEDDKVILDFVKSFGRVCQRMASGTFKIKHTSTREKLTDVTRLIRKI